MSNIYKPEEEELHKLISYAGDTTGGATLLIPDLQRPYVWKPKDVILLSDSLIRGWPFGTLTMWAVDEEDNTARIPSRTFYEVVDKTKEDGGKPVEPMHSLQMDQERLMVLDGQQRLQSFFLSVGKDTAGVIWSDYEWILHYTKKRRHSQTALRQKKCPKACLYFDLSKYLDAYNSCEGDIQSMDYSADILVWALPETDNFVSAYQNFPLKNKKKGDCLVRFSKIWSWASEMDGLYDFEKILKKKNSNGECLLEDKLKQEHIPSTSIDQLLTPVSKILFALIGVRNSSIPYLKIFTMKNIGEEDESKYNNTVVTIFTRLNNGGYQLKDGEITFAWVKRGWDKSSTENKTAIECFKNLRNKMNSDCNVSLSDDDLVILTRLIWAVTNRDEGEPIKNSDLMDGKLIGKYSKGISGDWSIISNHAVEVMKTLKIHNLSYKTHYLSLNTLVLIWSWCVLAKKWELNNVQGVPYRIDCNQKIEAVLSKYIDRWVFCSSWSGIWSDDKDALKLRTKKLHFLWDKINTISKQEEFIKELDETLSSMNDDIKEKSKVYISSIKAIDRKFVSMYRNLLWLWHRLDKKRYELSKDLMIDVNTKKEYRLEVDHCVPVNIWEKMLASENILKDSQDYIEKMQKINLLGNCTLLDKGPNISKLNNNMDNFLKKILSLNKPNWQKALKVNDKLMKPESYTVAEVLAAIETRDAELRDELKQFADGNIIRQDL